MYTISPQLPFLAGAAAYIVGFFITFLLTEPKIDTEKFNLKNFIFQTQQGFRQLFSSPKLRRISLFFMSIGFFYVILYEILEDALTIEFGFTPIQFGFLATIYYVVSAGTSLFTPLIIKRFKELTSVFILMTLIALTLIISPFLGMIMGGIIIISRVALDGIVDNIVSIVINKHAESKYRTTMLSTLYMLRNIPYIFLAYFIGVFMDLWSAKFFAAIVGILLLLLLLFFRLQKPLNQET